jgi:hypothetical protein
MTHALLIALPPPFEPFSGHNPQGCWAFRQNQTVTTMLGVTVWKSRKRLSGRHLCRMNGSKPPKGGKRERDDDERLP